MVDVTRRGFGAIVAGAAASVLPLRGAKAVGVLEKDQQPDEITPESHPHHGQRFGEAILRGRIASPPVFKRYARMSESGHKSPGYRLWMKLSVPGRSGNHFVPVILWGSRALWVSRNPRLQVGQEIEVRGTLVNDESHLSHGDWHLHCTSYYIPHR